MSRAAALNRHNARELGRFTSQATLRANQRVLLAPVARWRKEPVKLGNANIRVTKWVKWLEEGADEDDQVTEEQLTASVDGANSFLQPAAAATAASMPPSAVNTPPVNTPAINTSGSETPLIAIKPGMGLEVPGTVTPVGESSLQLPPSSTLPIDPSPLGTQSETATTDVQVDSQADLAISSMVTEENTQEMSARDTVPGEGDDGSNMQVEADQREYDTNMVPELQGAEAAQTRTLLGIGDPVGGGPQEIVEPQ